MYPTQLHSYMLWRSTVKPDSQRLATWRYTTTVSLIPATMVGIFVFGWWAAWIIFLSMAAALLTDIICHRFIYRDIPGTRDGTWILTGLLLGLLVPPNVPWFFPVIGAVLAIAIGKHYLSVEGMPLLQPAAIGLLALHLLGFGYLNSNPMLALHHGRPCWPVLARGIEPSADARSPSETVTKLLRDFFGGDIRKSVTRPQWRDAIFDGRTPVLANGEPAQAVHEPRPIDRLKISALSAKSAPETESPSEKIAPESVSEKTSAGQFSWLDMLLGYVPATTGGSSALALGFGILLLIFTGAASPMIPLFALGSMFATLSLLSWLSGGSADPRLAASSLPVHLMTGSTLLAIFYLAADPTTAPRSILGRAYAGVGLGVLEVLLRTVTPLPEALFVSVVLVQASSFMIDQWLAPPREDIRTISGPSLTTTSLGRL